MKTVNPTFIIIKPFINLNYFYNLYYRVTIKVSLRITESKEKKYFENCNPYINNYGTIFLENYN